jgi:hypothetical protein
MQVGLRNLLERDRDASDITELMKLARQAITVSGDARRARVIFDELRRKIGAESVEPTPARPWRRSTRIFELGFDDLALRIVELASRPESVPDPGRESRRDQFAICLAMMATGPRAPMTSPCWTTFAAPARARTCALRRWRDWASC